MSNPADGLGGESTGEDMGPSMEGADVDGGSAAVGGCLSSAKEQAQPENGSSTGHEDEEPRVASKGKRQPLEKPGQADCPRCGSSDTKFCYYNNYNVKQPRYFCKACQRYWTAGGTLRNVPPGSGRRKSKSAAAKEAEKQQVMASELTKQQQVMLASSAAGLTSAYLNPMLTDPMLAYNALGQGLGSLGKMQGMAGLNGQWGAGTNGLLNGGADGNGVAGASPDRSHAATTSNGLGSDTDVGTRRSKRVRTGSGSVPPSSINNGHGDGPSTSSGGAGGYGSGKGHKGDGMYGKADGGPNNGLGGSVLDGHMGLGQMQGMHDPSGLVGGHGLNAAAGGGLGAAGTNPLGAQAAAGGIPGLMAGAAGTGLSSLTHSWNQMMDPLGTATAAGMGGMGGMGMAGMGSADPLLGGMGGPKPGQHLAPNAAAAMAQQMMAQQVMQAQQMMQAQLQQQLLAAGLGPTGVPNPYLSLTAGLTPYNPFGNPYMTAGGLGALTGYNPAAAAAASGALPQWGQLPGSMGNPLAATGGWPGAVNTMGGSTGVAGAGTQGMGMGAPMGAGGQGLGMDGHGVSMSTMLGTMQALGSSPKLGFDGGQGAGQGPLAGSSLSEGTGALLSDGKI